MSTAIDYPHTTFAKFLLNKIGLRRYPMFRRPLASVVSRDHKERIFGKEK